MITFTDLEYKKVLDSLPNVLQDKLLFLSKDEDFLKIINHGVIKNSKDVDSIGYITRMVALGFASKEEMFDLIYETLNHNEGETRRIFKALDDTILVPNNFNGDKTQEDKEEEGDDVTNEEEHLESTRKAEDDKYSENTNESAEDILREIENPTPAPSILVRPTETLREAPKEILTPTPTDLSGMEIEIENTPARQKSAVDSVEVETIPVQTADKETQLDSKLTEPVVQSVKSTYYKLDPYREPPE